MEAFKLFFEQVIPFAIVVVLFSLAAVFIYTVKLLMEAKKSMEDINHKLVELEEPLKVVAKLSNTVGSIHDKGGMAVSRVMGSTSSNISMLRGALNMALNRSKKKERSSKS